MANAVIIGAGPAGLATAIMLARRGMGVVVLDRDGPAPANVTGAWDGWERRSIAQFRQVHFLQPAARVLLEDQLPEVVEQLLAAGAVRYNFGAQLALQLPDGPGDIDFSGFETITTCRRPVLEFAFLAAARAFPGVEIHSRRAVTDLVVGPDVITGIPHVVGVKTADGGTILGDVVVDTSGRRTAIPALVEAAGGRR
ncbi:MAG TPA: FAD-dependent oxidoreductase, partial [Acidimicrobiales bacterium]|nr:FAD-dependent oxidoreductase [Acidimicrobiales bacterium]